MTIRPHPLHLAAGLTLWFTYFIVVYGGMSVGCEISDARDSTHPFTLINGFVLLATVVFAIPLAWLSWQCHKATPDKPNQGRFVLRLAAILYAISALATVLVGLPGVIYPPCI